MCVCACVFEFQNLKEFKDKGKTDLGWTALQRGFHHIAGPPVRRIGQQVLPQDLEHLLLLAEISSLQHELHHVVPEVVAAKLQGLALLLQEARDQPLSGLLCCAMLQQAAEDATAEAVPCKPGEIHMLLTCVITFL